MPMRRIDEGQTWRMTVCRDPEHEPPTMIHIPAGEGWEHICATCGKRTIMFTPLAELSQPTGL